MNRATVIAVAAAVLAVGAYPLGYVPGNVHNGLIAVAFALVGLGVLRAVPSQREGRLFVAVGAVQAVMFALRQYGAHVDWPGSAAVLEVGTRPLPLVVLLVGATVMAYPDGRLPGRVWVVALQVMAVVAVVAVVWPPLQKPSFAVSQVVWAVCVVDRWRRADSRESQQLRWFVGAMAGSAAVLLLGLLITRTPTAGLFTVPLLPIAAGAALIRGAYDDMADELRAAARRIVTEQDDARRRLERDLHDGAQQRLVLLGLELSAIVDRARGGSDPVLADAACEARDQLLAALAELRTLARGIHPSVLSQDGLAAALGQLVERSPIPVQLGVEVADRCSSAAEAAAYFVVSEALTNAARHSGASRVDVSARRAAGQLVVEVADDGCGGATLNSGLQGLADRVVPLGGRFEVESPYGGGTRMTAVIPCG